MGGNKKLAQKHQTPARHQPAPPAPPQQNPNNSIQVATHHVEFQGPIPPPDILEKYDGIQAGFADRIIKMAEAEQEHRHALEATVVRESFMEAKRGQMYGLTIGMLPSLPAR